MVHDPIFLLGRLNMYEIMFLAGLLEAFFVALPDQIYSKIRFFVAICFSQLDAVHWTVIQVVETNQKMSLAVDPWMVDDASDPRCPRK